MTRRDRLVRAYLAARAAWAGAQASGDYQGAAIMRAEARRLRLALSEGC